MQKCQGEIMNWRKIFRQYCNNTSLNAVLLTINIHRVPEKNKPV